MNTPETITIDDVRYIRADSALVASPDGLRYCVVRTYSAGVHIGYVQEFAEKHPQQATLCHARRLHHWVGACSLSQVAMDGVGEGSRISVTVPEITLTDVVEIIPCSEKAQEYFISVAAWKK